LETFRLPGESQQIDRITETFADAFIESRPVEVANQEAAYVLAFSVIMLNTDQHNRQVRVSTNPCSASNCVTTLHFFSNNILKAPHVV
jgi:Sec7-like guanine-nucleotide exchange factor